jgi:hypothetical protein
MGFVLPSVAQVSHDFNSNDREPGPVATITKDQVPVAVQVAFKKEFSLNDPLTWSRFPFALKEYGWVYDEGASDVKLDRYLVQMKTNKGNELDAVYSASGDLIESREVSTNIAIPPTVMEAFTKSQYKDWNIVGNKEIIRYYHDHNNSSVEQHIRLNVEKDGVKRAISFNYQGGVK